MVLALKTQFLNFDEKSTGLAIQWCTNDIPQMSLWKYSFLYTFYWDTPEGISEPKSHLMYLHILQLNTDRIDLWSWFQHQATHTPRSGFGQSLSSTVLSRHNNPSRMHWDATVSHSKTDQNGKKQHYRILIYYIYIYICYKHKRHLWQNPRSLHEVSFWAPSLRSSQLPPQGIWWHPTQIEQIQIACLKKF